jgi:hypothetical protein
MNRDVRDELLRVLSGFSDHAPDMRFGQLIANLAFLARSSGPSDIWDVEDEELLEAAQSHLRDLEHRSEAMTAETSA